LKGEETMVIIIHGGHREGLCFNASQTLKQFLEQKNAAVKLYSLRDYKFEFCCGDQPCQNTGGCIYNDVITDEIIPSIANSDALILFTPTYFNLPPAILKNFIDRCNLLLTIEPRKRLRFSAWISGQTEYDSLEQCYKSLSTFAEICEFDFLDNGRIIRIEQDTQHTQLTDADIVDIEKLASEIIKLR
jgi:multimeric flavodoxin WrbA